MLTEMIDLDALKERYRSTLADRRQRIFGKREAYEDPRRRWLVWLSGGAFTCLLHSLFLATWLLGIAGRKPHAPMSEGAAASALSQSAGERISQLFFINDHGIATETLDDAQDAVYQPPPPATQPSQIASTESKASPGAASSSDGKDDDSPTMEATGDESGRALLFGRYMNQIKARIERAWTYPTQTEASRFRCKVRIKQSKQGDVQEVMLESCKPDAAWQQSLITAIQQASPLSAPPDESVFSDLVTLTFEPVRLVASLPQ